MDKNFRFSKQVVCGCLVLAVLSSFGCGPNNKQSLPSNNAVIIGYWGDETIFFHDYWGMEAAYLMFLPLVSSPENEESEIQPLLAERWEHSADYRNWTFFLRKDVKWHDGVPFTSHDIVFTHDLRYKVNELRRTQLPADKQFKVEAIDDFTCVFDFPEPYYALDTYGVFYPKHLLEDLEVGNIRNWDFWKAPIGNGPYRYVRHVPKTLVELEANPEYFRGKPKIGRAILKFIESEDTYFVELSSGNVDAISYVSLDMPMKLANDDRYRFYYYWGTEMETIYWNNRHPLFNNPKIRRALTLAINRAELPAIMDYPGEVPTVDTIVTDRLFRKNDYPAAYPHDRAEALRLLEEEGWRDSDGDGLLDRTGEDFKFQLNLADPILEPAAVFIQAELKNIGVKIDIQFYPRPVVMQQLKSGDYDAVLHHFINDLSQPNWGQIRFFGRESLLGYDNSEVDRLLRLAEKTIDPEEQDKIFRTIMPLFREDLPATFLIPVVQLFVAHKRIKGLQNIYRVDPAMYLEYLWIEEE